ncbi:MAG: hypothetical protein HY216_08035 [Candidatus Rokubacteria bacterium]|nr:hypothetical protein [Candidatus Rokubacteria bacterium]
MTYGLVPGPVGYEVDASTVSDFSGLVTSSVTYNVALTTLDWDTLLALRSAGASDPSFAFLRDVVTRLRPFVDDDDRARLAAVERAGAPNGLRLSLGLRVEPARFVDDAIAWLRAATHRVRDDVLASLARTGPWYSMTVERSIFLGALP